jgi:hypothetical protein
MRTQIAQSKRKRNPSKHFHGGAGGEIRTHVLLRDGILSPAHEAPLRYMRLWFDLALLPLRHLHLLADSDLILS